MNGKGNDGSNGNSFANGLSNSGNGGSDPNWQRRLYGWLADVNCWTFMEPGCTS